MQRTVHFFPLALPFVIGFLALLGFLLLLIELGILGYAYEKIGVSPRWAVALLALSVLGSYVNIPVGELPAASAASGRQVVFFGVRYVVPVVEEAPRTLVAVNVGGAIVPMLLSVYLLVKTSMYGRGVLAALIVAAVVHRWARPVAGIGIVVPIFVAPIVAVAVAWLLAPSAAPALADVAGSLGALIGADLLSLTKVRGLGAPIVSIGGAGRFDGIFLTGVLAVLLA